MADYAPQADPPEAIADPPSPIYNFDDEDAEMPGDEVESEEDEYAPQDDDATHHEEEEEDIQHDGRERARKPRDYRHLRIKATLDLPLLDDPKIAPSYREIGQLAHWSLSSSKPGNGVDQLRDSSLETYWQSDGLQPHYINIQFPRRQTVCALALYLDFNLDESYTPKKFKVRVGTTFHNLEEVRVVEVREPCGWCVVPLWRKWGEDVLDAILDPDGGDSDDEDDDNGQRRKKHHVPVWKRKPLRTHFVQIGIMFMHQNGRDTHVRQVKVFGPRDDGSGSIAGNGTGYGFGSSYRGLVMSRGKSGSGRDDTGGAAEMMMGSARLNMPTFQTVGMSQFSSIR
jgi:anaphase-promoting complex subunit 10